MHLERLHILHWPYAAASQLDAASAYAAAGAELQIPGAFFLGTCQRKIWVFTAEQEACCGAELKALVRSGAEHLRGTDAYRLLLRVATGLESQVRGETDIFGQLKDAWKKHVLATDPNRAPQAALQPWFNRLFEDTKEIRSLYLQNVGGDSYGSLIRRVLRKYSGVSPEEPILLIGAGQIAQSVAPWLANQEIWIWNRTTQSADSLASDLRSRHGARVRVLQTLHTDDELHEGWRKAAHAVVCIPADAQADRARIESWRQGSSEASHPRALIHLAGARAQLGAWSELEHFHSLDDLFALQREQNDARRDLFSRAERACEEKALLRSLSGSSHLPHGWEDLAIFA